MKNIFFFNVIRRICKRRICRRLFGNTVAASQTLKYDLIELSRRLW